MYHIHAKDCGDHFLYRVWDIIHFEYVTKELSKDQIILWLREKSVIIALREFESRIGDELERANSTGSSHPGDRSKGRIDWEKSFSDELKDLLPPDDDEKTHKW
jgi:hypothetical protein